MGSAAVDLWVGYPRWFVSIPAHGLEGLIAWLGNGRSPPIQILFCAISGIVIASAYFYANIFIKGWVVVCRGHCLRCIALVSQEVFSFEQRGIRMFEDYSSM